MKDELSYRVRFSPRARHVRLRITPEEGLTVVLPRGFDPGRVPGLVEERRGWIERHLGRLARRPEPETGGLPDVLELDALGERWTVVYTQGGTRRSLQTDPVRSRLLFRGPSLEPGPVFESLRGWLRSRARETLEPWARSLGEALGLHPANIGIRNQRRRWGSCNGRYDLSLNLKLLFLNPDQVRYVLVHELCHIRHRDHSQRFWRLVARHEPDCERLDGSMRDAWRRVPAWV